MLLLIFADHLNIHTLCLVKPLVHKRDVRIRHIKLPPQFGKFSSPVSRRICSRLRTKAALSSPETMLLCSPRLDGNQSLRGFYLYKVHLAFAVQSNIYITLHTSKPLSRLVKASFNPLFAHEILSTTIPNQVRCASEIAACSRRPINVSGYAPNNPGLFLLVSLGAENSGLREAEELPSSLCGLGEILRDDTLGSSAS